MLRGWDMLKVHPDLWEFILREAQQCPADSGMLVWLFVLLWSGSFFPGKVPAGLLMLLWEPSWGFLTSLPTCPSQADPEQHPGLAEVASHLE